MEYLLHKLSKLNPAQKYDAVTDIVTNVIGKKENRLKMEMAHPKLGIVFHVR